MTKWQLKALFVRLLFEAGSIFRLACKIAFVKQELTEFELLTTLGVENPFARHDLGMDISLNSTHTVWL